VFSWERAADPATGSDTVQTYLGDIAGVDEMLRGEDTRIRGLRILDDYTIEVQLTAPIVYFLAKLAYPVAFVVDRENVDASNWEHEPNGTGPFTLQVWRDDEIMVLARFEHFYLEPANISHLVYDLGPNLPLASYETDEIDAVGIGGGSLDRARQPDDPLYPDLLTGVSMCTSVIGLNNSVPPFDDVRVRHAFNYALDKEQMVDAFSGGNALVATSALPPGMPGFIDRSPGYAFDPERARNLLADAGYPGGSGFPALTYTTSGYGDAGGYVTAVITMWQENLNVKIDTVVIDPFMFYEELHAGNVGNIFSSGWCADYPDPQNFLDVLYHSESQQNLGKFSDPVVDELLEEARIETDVPARLSLYAEIEHRIVEAAPVVFVSHGLSAVLVKPRVQGFVLTPIGVPQWHRITLTE
jgi:oligopeptide transport system substrate-binding protein